MAQPNREPSDSEESSTSSGMRIKTENENWRGKNDPTERRRIQNRLNQRAFRRRQRTGESPPTGESTPTSSPDRGQAEGSQTVTALAATSGTASRRQSTTAASAEGPVWDELAQTINRNLMEAVAVNARTLGIDQDTLQRGEPVTTPIQSQPVPASLVPVALQYQTPHDLLYDTIPHARLRHNIMAAITTREVDQVQLSSCIRGSGALEMWNGTRQRRGMVVWSDAFIMQSWELSERFARTWAMLLDGCEDLIDATNAWRRMRGESPISLRRTE